MNTLKFKTLYSLQILKFVVVILFQVLSTNIFFAQNIQADVATFAVISDTHIGKPGNDKALKLVVEDINKNHNIEFVIHAGDVSDFGTRSQLTEAKSILNKLQKPYLIIPGNHDTYWSDNAGMAFEDLWDGQKFVKDIKGVRYIGISTGPYVRATMTGYVPKDQIYWLDSIASVTDLQQPVVIIAHIPLSKDNISNFKELLSTLKQMNVIMVLSGHGHSNKVINESGFKSLMTTTTQFRNEKTAYNIITLNLANKKFVARVIHPNIQSDSIWTTQTFIEKEDIETELLKTAESETESNINDKVKIIWEYQDAGNIISTPAVLGNNILFGNTLGNFKSLNISNSKVNWQYKTGGPIYSSPAVFDNKVVFACADSIIYCLDDKSGTLVWKIKTDASVLSSPVIDNGIVFIGGSDNKFRAIDLKTGEIKWVYKYIKGFTSIKPSISKGKIVFGNWAKMLYAINMNDGTLAWSWENKIASAYYSPAICSPVIIDEVVYIVSPDEKLRAFDLMNGVEIFTLPEKGLWESLGGENNRLVAKTTDGSVIGWNIEEGRNLKEFININIDDKKDLSPSIPLFYNDYTFLCTNSGKVISIDLIKKNIVWSKKIGNNMINNLSFYSKNIILAAGIDGRIVLLENMF